jgi:hypothetical protein
MVGKLGRAASLVVVLACLGGCSTSASLPWRTISFGKDFSIDFPGEPDETSQPGSGPWGSSTTYRRTLNLPDGGLTFQLTYYDKTDESSRKREG